MLVNQARRFGETLVDRHVLSRDDLEQAIEEAERTKQPLPSVLLRLGLVGSKDLTAALAEQMGVRFIDFLETPIHQDAPDDCSPPSSRGSTLAVPVDFEGHKLVVAFAEPADDDGGRRGRRARPATRSSPRSPTAASSCSAIDMIYGAGRRATPASSTRTSSSATSSKTSCTSTTCSTSSIQWGGSDLHLASGSPPVIRVHGDLRPITELPMLNGSQIRQMVYLDPHAEAAGEVRERARARHARTRCRARAASASTCSCSATPSAA